MRSYVYILYQLGHPLTRIPPEALAALVLLVITNPGVLPALLFILKFIGGLIVGEIVVWYLKEVSDRCVWSELPSQHQRTLLEIRDCTLPKKPDQDHPTARDEESAFSKNSKRHPHW